MIFIGHVQNVKTTFNPLKVRQKFDVGEGPLGSFLAIFVVLCQLKYNTNEIFRDIPVILMVPLDHRPTTISLTPLDNLIPFRVDLKGPLLAVHVLHGAHAHILQRDDALWHVLCRVLEVVETAVVQHEPAPFPRFPTAALQKKSSQLLI